MEAPGVTSGGLSGRPSYAYWLVLVIKDTSPGVINRTAHTHVDGLTHIGACKGAGNWHFQQNTLTGACDQGHLARRERLLSTHADATSSACGQ